MTITAWTFIVAESIVLKEGKRKLKKKRRMCKHTDRLRCVTEKEKIAKKDDARFLYFPLSLSLRCCFFIIRLNTKLAGQKSRAWSNTQRQDLIERKMKFLPRYRLPMRSLKIFTHRANVPIDLLKGGQKYKFHSFRVHTRRQLKI